MKVQKFEEIIQKRLEVCQNVLTLKADEYATNKDRLANFYTAAVLQHTTPQVALGGMLAKHIVAIFDFLADLQPADHYRWVEKITDSINYLLLLEAILIEEGKMEDRTND